MFVTALGAQTERRGLAGLVEDPLGGETSPAASSTGHVPITQRCCRCWFPASVFFENYWPVLS